ncbi:SCP-like protein [Teladorsagia circumcincta]|uniref:SCP-like protein n=1 Tax=Teladorsagia circumcincta TaxID=45464 RepID=A0A2G9V077_TELCI|nr:SCP-like protein [Teladorsagia circumcincta]
MAACGADEDRNILLGEVNFQRGCLDAHNDLRQRYGVTPLIWSAELADMAHAWAVKLSDRGRMLYPELPGIGENILLTDANDHTHLPTGAEVVTRWETEVDQFDFDRPRWSPSMFEFVMSRCARAYGWIIERQLGRDPLENGCDSTFASS